MTLRLPTRDNPKERPRPHLLRKPGHDEGKATAVLAMLLALAFASTPVLGWEPVQGSFPEAAAHADALLVFRVLAAPVEVAPGSQSTGVIVERVLLARGIALAEGRRFSWTSRCDCPPGGAIVPVLQETLVPMAIGDRLLALVRLSKNDEPNILLSPQGLFRVTQTEQVYSLHWNPVVEFQDGVPVASLPEAENSDGSPPTVVVDSDGNPTPQVQRETARQRLRSKVAISIAEFANATQEAFR